MLCAYSLMYVDVLVMSGIKLAGIKIYNCFEAKSFKLVSKRVVPTFFLHKSLLRSIISKPHKLIRLHQRVHACAHPTKQFTYTKLKKPWKSYVCQYAISKGVFLQPSSTCPMISYTALDTAFVQFTPRSKTLPFPRAVKFFAMNVKPIQRKNFKGIRLELIDINMEATAFKKCCSTSNVTPKSQGLQCATIHHKGATPTSSLYWGRSKTITLWTIQACLHVNAMDDLDWI